MESLYLLEQIMGEFKNKLLKDYLSENNIKYVKGLPYKPHSQGVCERVHKTIKTGLLVKK